MRSQVNVTLCNNIVDICRIFYYTFHTTLFILHYSNNEITQTTKISCYSFPLRGNENINS